MIKIGLVAPFEGRYRAIGYEAIYAARLAIREINARGGVRGYKIELVALDDRADPDQAIESIRQLTIDPQVIAVFGHYRPDTTDAAMTVDCAQPMPVLAIESASTLSCAPPSSVFVIGRAPRDRWAADRITFVGSVPDPNTQPGAKDFVSHYNAIPIDGTRAGPIALQTYDVMYLLFDAIGRAAKIDRAGIGAAIAAGSFSGLGGHYAFDRQGNLIDATSYVYEYDWAGNPQLINQP